MKIDSCLKDVAVIVLLMVLFLQWFAAGQLAATLTASGFGPSSSATGPRIVWTPPTANAWGNFTLTSAASNSSMRYVSFAFAYKARMADAILVVDCNEFNGTVILGTSKNALVAGSGVNIVDPSLSDQVRLLSATKRDGVLTCSFSMNFSSTLDVYVLLATGNLALKANASSLRKSYHGPYGRFASDSTIGQMVTTAAMTPSSTTLSILSIPTSMLTFAGFGPSSPSAAGPRIVWTAPAINSLGMFTLTSAASGDSSNRYVSFAFAYGRRMVDTLTIVDCSEIDGLVTLGTSRNIPSGTNVNDPASLDQVQLQSTSKRNGVLTCSFSMKFPPTLDVYVVLATGPMAAGASASSPRKLYHGANGRFVSKSTIEQLFSSAAAKTFLSTTYILLAAITLRVVGWR